MKTYTTSANYFIILFIIVSVVFTGCGSTSGLERSEAMTTTMDRVDQDVTNITTQVNAVNSALSELTRRGQGDLRGAYNQFSEQLSELRDLEGQFENSTKQMESNAKAYFEGWAKSGEQYENSEIQRRSEERRTQISQRFDRISQNSATVKQDLRSYISSINEIESYLSNDLTNQGINSIASVANDSINDGDQLKSELDSLQSAIAATRNEIRQGGITMN